jgi:hypothetical protein
MPDRSLKEKFNRESFHLELLEPSHDPQTLYKLQ